MRLLPNQRVFEAASREPGRYAMMAVRLRLLDGKPVLEAMNGRILSRVEVEQEEGEELAWLPPEGVLLSSEDMRDAWPSAKNGKKGLFLRRDEGDWFLDCAGSRTRLSTIDGEFPRVDAVVAMTDDPAGSVGLAIDYLNMLAKAAGASGLRLLLPKYEKGQVRGPIGIVFTDEAGSRIRGVLGAIMPITVDE